MKDYILAVLASGGVLVTILSWGRDWWKTHQAKKKLPSGDDVDPIDVLIRIVNETVIDRALIIRKSNGAGQPYIYIDHEAHNPNVEPEKQQFQGVEMDLMYEKLILSLKQEKVIFFKVADLHPNAFLRMIYEASGIQEGFIFEIKAQQGVYRYGSFTSQSEEIPKKDKVIIQLAIRQIRRLYR